MDVSSFIILHFGMKYLSVVQDVYCIEVSVNGGFILCLKVFHTTTKQFMYESEMFRKYLRILNVN